ncbi:MAG: DUF1667 domain-containing protein [Oscillospiraceae bacterium]|nr:DUF1667 domain-containing protein [Oscillospiraceae bacterium]
MADIICIVCPKGCRLTVDEETLAVKGNGCERGLHYGKAELTAPVRVVTSTVKTQGGSARRCPVKTAGSVPKCKVTSVMHALNGISLTCPVKTGQIVLANVADTGIAVVATKDIV